MASNDPGSNGNGAANKGPARPNRPPTIQRYQELSLHDIVAKIYAHKAVVTITFALVALASAVYTFTRKPLYESSTKILITKSSNNSQSMLDGISNLFQPIGSDERRITDEMAILQTDLLRDRVAEDLLQDPVMKVGRKSDTLSILLPSRAEKLHGVGPFAGKDEIAGRLFGAVTFTNQPNSDIIIITVKSHSPWEAASIANAYAKEYYSLNLSTSRTMATNVRRFLQNQLGDARTALASAEDSLQDYMESQHIVSLDQEASALIEALSSMEAQRDDVVVQEKAEEDVLDIYRSQLSKTESSFSSHVSDALDPYITLLQQQIAQLQVNRDIAVVQSTPDARDRNTYNAAVARIDSQIAGLRRKLQAKSSEFLKSQILATGSPQKGQNGGSYDPTGYYTDLKLKVLQGELQLSSTRAQAEALNGIIGKYEGQFSKIPRQYIRLAQLERTEKSRSKLFLMIQDNFQQAQIAEQSQFGNVQIIDPARPQFGPISPKVPFNLTLGILLGLALGVGLAFVLERMDGSVKSPEDLEKKGFKVLSAIPVIPGAEVHGSDKLARTHGIPAPLITVHSPSDPISESYLTLRTAVQYSKIVRKIDSVLVASALPKEGKSTTVANLGVVFARTGMRTLILDADFRRPIQHRLWNVERKPGLVDSLKGETDLNTAVRKTTVDNLFVLTTGAIPPNPSELLGSGAMKDTMDILKSTFDMVFVDSPPVLAVTDAVVLSQLTDAVVLVTCANKTKSDVLDKANESLKQVDANVIGVVLNEFEYSRIYGSYYRYYNRYYGQRETSDEKKRTE